MKIPFNKPSMTGQEMRYIKDALSRGQLSGDGFYSIKSSHFLEKILGVPRVLLTSSCTHSLELAYLLINIKKGDEVILPSFTFPSTANAFVLWGGVPKFVDIRPDTLNIDEKLIDDAVTSRTKAISPVHYGGVPCQMDAITRLAKRHGLFVVEDAAQALGSKFRGSRIGHQSDFSAFSFHETKNVMCGEGGALAIKNPTFIKRAEILRQKGTNRAAFYRGEIDKYSWVDKGSSYVPSELQAAFLYAQLEKMSAILQKRRRIYERYFEALQPFEKSGKILLPVIPKNCHSSYHLFHLILESEARRDRVINDLRAQGINSVFHYFPLHLSAMGRRFGAKKGDCPVSESISPRLIRIPLYNNMTASEQNYVIKYLKKALT